VLTAGWVTERLRAALVKFRESLTTRKVWIWDRVIIFYPLVLPFPENSGTLRFIEVPGAGMFIFSIIHSFPDGLQ
jgi:hypothetical protein